MSYLPTRRGYDTFFGHFTEQTDHYTRRLDKEAMIGSGYDLRRGEEVTEDGAGLYSSDLWAKVGIHVMFSWFGLKDKLKQYYLDS